MFLPLEKWLEYYASLSLPSDSWLMPINFVHEPISSATLINFIFNNELKLWLCHNFPHRYSYLEWSVMCIDISTLCNNLEITIHNWVKAVWLGSKNEYTVKWLWVLGIASFMTGKNTYPLNGLDLVQKDREDKMGEREKKSARTHTELILVYIFILCLLDWSPTSCQLTRLTAI
jgi:hypothetical protein